MQTMQMIQYIASLPLKDVRRIYKKLREHNGKPFIFLPFYGITLGQFCLAQVVKKFI